jgi:hypothetical protein
MNEIKKFDDNVKFFKERLTQLNVINDWEDGKLEKLISGSDLILSLFNDVLDKVNDGSILDEVLKIRLSSVSELFNLKESVRYVQGDIDDVVNVINAKEFDLNINPSLLHYTGSVYNKFFDNFLIVIFETFNEIKSKNDFYKRNEKLDSLEDELQAGLLSEESLVVNVLLQSKIKLIEKLFSDIFPSFIKSNEWIIEDKIDLIKKIISHLETTLMKDKQLVPFSKFTFFSKSITISKSTSDKYCISLIKMYVQKLKDLGCIYVPKSLKDRYPKVTFKVDIQKLQNHLSKLLVFQGESLKTALECNEIDSPILFSCQLNVFVYFFHHSQNDLFVEGTTLTDIEDWLAFYFVRVNKKGKKFLLTKPMCHKILSNKKHKPKLNHKKITHFK